MQRAIDAHGIQCTNDKCRYGRVICCIGVNPDKTYVVTPQKRAQILRGMLTGSDDGKVYKNVQVEGMDK